MTDNYNRKGLQMDSRPKGNSPRLDIEITDEQLAHAIRSNSGGCLIAEAIKARYPTLSKVAVDMATIRVTDPKRGERYTYLTPPDAQHILLSFDQGWPIPTRKLTIRRAVHVGVAGVDGSRKSRDEQVADIERRDDAGEPITDAERKRLNRSRAQRKGRSNQTTPKSHGPKGVVIVDGQPVVTGGKPPVTGGSHPNLLRGRDRHYGARLADPGEAFRNAVDHAVEQRLAESVTTTVT